MKSKSTLRCHMLPPRDSKGGEGLLRAVGERKTLYLGFDRPRPCHGGKVIDSWLNQIIAMLLQKRMRLAPQLWWMLMFLLRGLPSWNDIYFLMTRNTRENTSATSNGFVFTTLTSCIFSHGVAWLIFENHPNVHRQVLDHAESCGTSLATTSILFFCTE